MKNPAELVKVYQWQTPWDSEQHEGDAEAFRAAIKEASDKDIEAGNLSFPVYGNALMESMTVEMQPMPTADEKDTMDARSVEILQQLQAEVWWPWDRRGDTDGGYNIRPQRPDRLGKTQEEHDAATEAYQRGVAEYDASPAINKNRWGRLLGELRALNPTNPDVQKLRDMYQRPQTFHNRQNKSLWLEAMLR